MTNLITDVARYVMILLIAFYTYLNFRYFSLDEERQNRLCGRQNRIMVLIQILAYGVMYLRTEDIRLPLFAAVQIVFFVAYILLYRVFYPYVSRILVNNVCIFLSIGLFMLSRLSFEKAERQFVIVVVSAVFTWIIPFIMDRVWQLVKIPWVYGFLDWFSWEWFPVVEKDFIFAAISEEMGAVFALCLLLICLGCFLQFMMMACKMQALFYKLIAFGFGMLYITQVFLAVGGAIKFIPSTGVTLPLVSYGGSSVLSTFMMFGVMQGLYILKRSEEEEDGYDS